jgi:hypothetical protein
MEVRRGRTSDQVTKAMKDTSKPRLNSYYGGAESCFVNSAGLEIERESALKGIFLLTRGSLLMEGCPGPQKTMVYRTGPTKGDKDAAAASLTERYAVLLGEKRAACV